MSKDNTVEVASLPPCDICGEPALYDANLGMGWANVCQKHFDAYHCSLGVGRGQILKEAK
jgi:hypothetical protein